MEATPRVETWVHAKVWDIQVTCSVVGRDLCRHLPFLHALPGCDTTLHLFVIAKTVSLKKAVQLYQHAEAFYQPNSLKQEITTAGESALAEVYGRKRIWRPCDIDGFAKRQLNEQQQLK